MLDAMASALRGVLEVISTDELVEGRIRLQKEAYLMALKGYEHFQPKRFTFYYYGPYSRDVSDALHFAVASGLIDETKEFYDGRPKYSYKLTPTGREWLDAEADRVDPSLRECSALFKKSHWRTLELAASALFLERAGDADRSDAISKALSLKPDCKPYKDYALKLIEQLRL